MVVCLLWSGVMSESVEDFIEHSLLPGVLLLFSMLF